MSHVRALHRATQFCTQSVETHNKEAWYNSKTLEELGFFVISYNINLHTVLRCVIRDWRLVPDSVDMDVESDSLPRQLYM